MAVIIIVASTEGAQIVHLGGLRTGPVASVASLKRAALGRFQIGLTGFVVWSL